MASPFICFFPEPDGVSCAATILHNTIEDCERAGLLFSCSFGPASNRQSLTVADNTLRGNKQFGLNILTAIPLADKVPQHGQLSALLAGNTIAASPVGIAVHGALGEARHNTCRVVIDRNEIADWKAHAIRLVGGSAWTTWRPQTTKSWRRSLEMFSTGSRRHCDAGSRRNDAQSHQPK